MSQLHNEISDKIGTFLTRCVTEDMTDHAILVSTYPGSGKSWSLWKVLEKYHPRFFYLAPRHNIIERMCDPSGVAHLYSKSHVVDGEPICRLSRTTPKIRTLVQRKRLLPDVFCDKCDYQYDCDVHRVHNNVLYGQKIGRNRVYIPWTGVHAHLSVIGKYPIDKYTVGIIDENPFTSMLNENVLSLETLRKIRIFNEDDDMERILQAMAHHLGGDPLRVPDVSSAWDPIKFMQSHRKRISEDYEVLGYIPHYGILSLISKFGDEEVYRKGVSLRRRGWPIPEVSLRLTYFNNEAINQLRIPLIFLDATGSTRLWKKMAPWYNIENVLDEKWRHDNVVHITDSGNYYRCTWESCKQDHPNWRLLRLICKQSKGDVIFCCSKAIRDKVQQYVDDDKLRYAIFKALTSDNSFWEKATTLVIGARPTLPPDDRQAMINATGFDEETIDYINVYSEIIQAIGRLRQNINEMKIARGITVRETVPRSETYIIIFPSLQDENPLEDWEAHTTTYVKIKRRDFIECLEHGYIHPVEYHSVALLDWAKKRENFTRTQMVRQYGHPDWLMPAFDLLVEDGAIRKVRGNSRRWTIA